MTGFAYAKNIENKQKKLTRMEFIKNIKSIPSFDKGALKKRRDLIKAGLKQYPNDNALLYQQALYFLDIEYYQSALTILNKLIKKDKKNANKYQKLKLTTETMIIKTRVSLSILLKKLHKNPKNVDLRLDIVNKQVQLHDYDNATKLVKSGLKLQPKNIKLLYQEALLEVDLEQYIIAEKTLQRLLELSPSDQGALALLSEVKELKKTITPKEKKSKVKKQHQIVKKPREIVKIQYTKPSSIRSNEIYIASRYPNQIFKTKSLDKKDFVKLIGTPVYISDRKQVWSYNSIIYNRATTSGSYLFYVNNRTRVREAGAQEGFEFFPFVTKNAYLDFGYDYSSSTLFPEHHGQLSVNILLPHNLQIQWGGQYYRIVRFNLWSQDTAIGNYFGNNWFELRSRIFAGKTFKGTLLLNTAFRHYYWNDNAYVELIAGGGNTPDLLDLSAAGFVIITTYFFYIKNEIPISKNAFFAIQFGYANEKFPKFIRERYSTMLELTGRF